MEKIIITAILVSLDALFVGMSLKLQKGFRLAYLFVIASIILITSLAAYFVAGAIAEHVTFETSVFVGAAFLILGIRSLFDKDEDQMAMATGTIAVLGLIMSIDGVVATTALTIEHGKILLTPFLMPIGHLLFLLAGCCIAKFIKTSHKVHKVISATCLFLVAILNFVDVI